MNKKYLNLILLAGTLITLIGLLTGKYLFLLLVIPLGFELFRKKDPD